MYHSYEVAVEEIQSYVVIRVELSQSPATPYKTWILMELEFGWLMVHLIVCVEPISHSSPPFGDKTVYVRCTSCPVVNVHTGPEVLPAKLWATTRHW